MKNVESGCFAQYLRELYTVFKAAYHTDDQCVESAGVAFVKGANERNELFEKKRKKVMYDE